MRCVGPYLFPLRVVPAYISYPKVKIKAQNMKMCAFYTHIEHTE
jgi:hypothetical protein